MRRRFAAVVFRLALALSPCLAAVPAAADSPLRVAVLDNAPPMAFRDENGQLTGFTVGIARALCDEMQAQCEFHVSSLAEVVDATSRGNFDIAAVSLLETPERRAKILFAKPYFRSVSLWFAKPGVAPGAPGVRVAVVKGSAQERLSVRRGWPTTPVGTHADLPPQLAAGAADAAIVPMNTALNLRKDKVFQELGLVSTVMNEPEISGDAAFGISPKRPELKERLDAALDHIKRSGVYDKINSRFLPFRVN